MKRHEALYQLHSRRCLSCFHAGRGALVLVFGRACLEEGALASPGAR